MQRPVVNTTGNALIITVLVSMVLMITLMGITTSLTVGNRQAAGNQGLAERAQFAAESGLARGVANLQLVENDLKRAKLDLSSGINNQAQLDAAMATLRAQMYSFCYGGPLNQSIPTAFDIKPSNVPAGGQDLCTGSIAPVNQSDSDATVGNTRMALIKDNIALTAYDPSNRFANDEAEAVYWGQVAKGTYNPAVTLSEGGNGISDRVRTSLDLSPRNIRIRADGGYDIILGDPSRGMVSVGEVVKGTTILASRTISQALNTNPASITMTAPSFASFAWFYNTHRLSINPADAAYNQATLITSSLNVNGPAFTNGRFVFASGATPTFASEFGSAGCENGVPSGGSCTNKAQQYHVGGVGTGTSYTTSSAAQWSGLNGITPNFAIKKNSLGKELCSLTVGGAEYECTASDPDSRKVRDVNWNRSAVTMPDTAIANFQTKATEAGITVNSADFTAPWTAGWKSFTNYSDICVTSTIAACHPMPASAVNGIGKFEGRPTITLSTVTVSGQQVQRITVTANAVRGYNFVIEPVCNTGGGGGGGGGGGVGGADAPSLRKYWTQIKPKVGEFFQAVGSALTFGSTALAQNTAYSSTWKCPTGTTRAGQAPSSWNTYWTQDDGNSNKVVISRSTGKPTNTTTGANATGSNLYYNSNTNQDLTIVYEVDSTGKIRMESNNTSSVNSTQTILPDRSSGNTLTVRTHPALATATATSVSSTYGTATFNGVLYRNGNYHLQGGTGADVARYQQITLAANGNIHLVGDVTYESNPITSTGEPPRNLMGLYAKNSIIIADGSRGTASTAGRTVDGVLMAETGSIRTGGYDWEPSVNSCSYTATKGNFTVRGSLIQNTLGATNCVNNGVITGGYVGNYTYDKRMLNGFAPPSFPNFSTGNWGFNAKVITPNQQGFWQVVPPQN